MTKWLIKNMVDTTIYIESFFHGKSAKGMLSSKKNAGDKKRVLIMRKDGLGDCLLFYPTLAAYRAHYADAELTLIFPKWFEPFAPLLKRFRLDNVIWFDHTAFSKSFSYRRKFLLDLKRAGYDIAIYPAVSREAIGNFMIQMTGATEITVPIPLEIKSELDRDIYIAEKITGTKSPVSFPTINLVELPDGKSPAENLLKKYSLENTRFAVIFPGAGADYRIWPAERFAKIIDHISARGMVSLICGSPKEKKLAASIVAMTASATKPSSKVVDLSGQTDLQTLAHILDHAAFYFGSDTGVLHIATAVGTPAIAITGSGGYQRFFPYGDPQKNRAVVDGDYMKNHPDHIGDWADAKRLPPGQVHPSILGISIESAQKEVDYMLDFVK